ncbi:MAG: FMN-binding negative transcriptional regulator [Planctomycetales bacterium]|nr:FMN-binding negative transcriptional regulator [Planctomycetales bacterium]MBN8624399.1 FMN-binding negative transcriptional regulator [Planctomycetota bacterium]
MYIPTSFRFDDQTAIFDFTERHGFATLVTEHDGAPFATHLPLIIERGAGECGAIVGHMARANPQWRDAAGQTVLVMYQGPHAYISPAWYAEPNTVPTWNYGAVHAYGKLEVVEDSAALTEIVVRTVEFYERSLPRPWQFDATTPLAEALIKQIIGFRIPVERWEGKWKLNQNHTPERQGRVIAALANGATDDQRAIAAEMSARQ